MVVCLCVSVYGCVSVCERLWLCFCMCVCVCVWGCVCVCVCVCGVGCVCVCMGLCDLGVFGQAHLNVDNVIVDAGLVLLEHLEESGHILTGCEELQVRLHTHTHTHTALLQKCGVR